MAEISIDAGYDVVGSDLQNSLMTDQLSKRGVAVNVGQDGNFLRSEHEKAPIDWFVHTSALPSDHPELVLAQTLGIRTTKRDELILRIVKDKNLKLIAIAGTHGKTTTTGMAVWALKQLGVPVSYSVGTTLSWGPSGHFDPESQYFVYECDEFDRNFLKFTPYLSLITSIRHDHPDTYPTEEEYKEAFRQFIRQSETTILWSDGADYIDNRDAKVWVLQKGETEPLPIAGEHNRRNATLVLKSLDKLKIGDNDAVKMALKSFPGTKRRFEKLAENLYSDYGHTPDEIAATLQMAKEVAKKVVLIYQPHQNIRQHSIRDDYTDEVFADASEVYWLPTYLSRENDNLAILTPRELTNNMARTATHYSDLNAQLWDDIQRHLDAGALVLCMGAASIDEWVRDQANIRRVANILLVEAGTGKLVMQQRDDKPEVYNPGMISAFGGSIEDGETARQAATRELREETNIQFRETDMTYLKTLFQPLNDGTSRWVTAYLLTGIDTAHLEIYEGEGYVLVDPLDMALTNLTPKAREMVEHYILGSN